MREKTGVFYIMCIRSRAGKRNAAMPRKQSLPLAGKLKFRGGRAFPEIRCGWLFAQIWPRMLQTSRQTQGMSLPQNSIALRAAPHRPGRKEKQERPLEKNEQQHETAIFSSFGLLEKVNPSAERKFHGEKSVHLNTTINRSILHIKFDKKMIKI